MGSWRLILLSVLTLIGRPAEAHVRASAGSPGEKQVDWGRDVRPILAARCFTCHGPDPSSRKANLRLDDPHSAKAVRSHGRAAVTSGDPDASELLARILTDDPEERMPPEGPPLSPEEESLIRRWIAEGAEWSEAWSWKPIAVPPVPDVRNEAWVADPIDRFTLARLEAAGLEPAPRADALTLLRRASVDLTGLPPDRAARERVAADPSAAAFAAEVDRMLASPAFGERWGRHWLDLMRYAETYGHEFDYPIPEAWRYRDAVVRAFAADVPFDRFLREHIAGDLLLPRRFDPASGLDEGMTLTGFWWLTQGTHAPVDVAKDEADRIDNQIDVLSKSFLGVTVSCARCHDHKFDAITQRDYYGISAHLKRARRAVVELDPGGAIAASRAAALDQRRAIEGRYALDRAGAPTECAPAERGSLELLTDFDEPLPEGFALTGHAFAEGADELPLCELHGDGARRAPLGIATSRAAGEAFAGTLRSPSFEITRRYLHQRLRGSARVRVIIDGYHLDEHNALLFEGHLKDVRQVDGFAVVTWDLARFRGHRAYIEWIDGGPGALDIDWVGVSDEPQAPSIAATEPRTLAMGEEDRAALAAAVARPPEPVRVIAIQDGSPWAEHVRTRGVASAIGESVTPGLVESLDRGDAERPTDRRTLADRIASREHPLTARVMANRIWHHLIGRGIVESVDDFGALGTPPSDPALLDHLADRFRSGWSVKGLVRSIVLSSTYAMSAVGDATAEERDPGNRIPHRAHLRRLDAESLRDALLSLAGRLDTTLGGPGVPTHLTDFMDGRGRPGQSGPLDGAGRRSIYLEVRRNFPDPFLSAFDLPIPTSPVGRRNRSNVPGQALALLNAPLVHAMATAWGERVAAAGGSVDERIGAMVEDAFVRPARVEEIAAMRSFLDEEMRAGQRDGDPDAAAWGALAHVLVNAKEFLFID